MSEQELEWHKSSYSGANGNCVEIAQTDTTVHVRDSKDPSGPKLHFDRTVWAGFVAGLAEGEFDLLPD